VTRIARLARTDAVEQCRCSLPAPSTCATFHRLSDVARSVPPHDAATVGCSRRITARIYALNGILWANVPEEFDTNYAAVFNEHFQFSIRRPAGQSGRTRAADGESRVAISAASPLRLDGEIGGALELARRRSPPTARRT
jgi:hypothetical protein